MHPTCPTCHAELARTVTGDLATWTCPSGHGAGLTLTEGYHHLQDDELHRAWAAARQGTPGPRACPVCGRPMVVVSLGITATEDDNAPATADEDLDVCSECEFIWFDPGEYEALPADLPNPEPSAQELAQVDQIRRAFGADVLAAGEARDAQSATGHLYRHLTHHPFVTRVAQRSWL